MAYLFFTITLPSVQFTIFTKKAERHFRYDQIIVVHILINIWQKAFIQILAKIKLNGLNSMDQVLCVALLFNEEYNSIDHLTPIV